MPERSNLLEHNLYLQEENEKLRIELEGLRRSLELKPGPVESRSPGEPLFFGPSVPQDQRIEEIWAMLNNISQELDIAPKEAKKVVMFVIERPDKQGVVPAPRLDYFSGVEHKVGSEGELRIINNDGDIIAEFPRGDWQGIWVADTRESRAAPDQCDPGRKLA